jgi:hypothetical protein
MLCDTNPMHRHAPPTPTPATDSILAELSAQANRPDRRILRWCRRWLAYALVVAAGLPVLVWRAVRWLVAYPCFVVLVAGAIVRRRFGRGE